MAANSRRLSQRDMDEIIALRVAGKTKTEIAKYIGVSRQTIIARLDQDAEDKEGETEPIKRKWSRRTPLICIAKSDMFDANLF